MVSLGFLAIFQNISVICCVIIGCRKKKKIIIIIRTLPHPMNSFSILLSFRHAVTFEIVAKQTLGSIFMNTMENRVL